MGKNEQFSSLSIYSTEIKSLRDIVLESLRESIITGKIKPGEHLKERQLAEAMGISTTPIKEALRILSHEGLVETYPRKGAYVSHMVETSIAEILMVRASLESLSARLCTDKIDEKGLRELEVQINRMEHIVRSKDTERLSLENTKFHQMIQQGAENPVIKQMLSVIVNYDNMFRKKALSLEMEVEEGFAEHRKIFEAIRDRDSELAEKRMKDHIMRTTTHVMKYLNIGG
ncbi:GntR family transcriptional regulator [Bacillus sp. EB01]|uniref:GntR family transcriptional regulator n=1 Tax=Bacillus sp. EB01 TaxID=1347086 RepID=UPI0005C5FD3D|nr:GntR family transcriptional regulator [Bacillus sp. EB01]